MAIQEIVVSVHLHCCREACRDQDNHNRLASSLGGHEFETLAGQKLTIQHKVDPEVHIYTAHVL
jgi:hypothetical protein